MDNNLLRAIVGMAWWIIFLLSTHYVTTFIILTSVIYILSMYEVLKLEKFGRELAVFLTICMFNIKYNISEIDKYFIVFCFVTVIDTSCYVFGKLFGKTTFTSISPNKTIEGLIGGGVTFMLVFYQTFPYLLLIMSFIFAVLGDLFFSYIKRINRIKDFSNIVPGHGGVLDRIDSLVITAMLLKLMNLL